MTMVQEVYRAGRFLCRNWQFTGAAVLSLTLGIGANIAIFSLINALLLTRLPVLKPNELVQIGPETTSGKPGAIYTRMLSAIERDPDVTGVCGFLTPLLTVQDGSVIRATSGLALTGSCFKTLGLQPAVGRFFTSEDSNKSDRSVVVLSYSTWKEDYFGSRSVVGRTILINGNLATIIGVAQPGFTGLFLGYPAKVIFPLMQLLPPVPDAQGGNYVALALVRVGKHISARQYDIRLMSMWPRVLAMGLPTSIQGEARSQYLRKTLITLDGGRWIDNTLQSKFSSPLYGLIALTGVMLFVSCFNVATLISARGIKRQRDLATRLALGASQTTLITNLMIENGTLLLFSTIIGIALAYSGVKVVLAYMDTSHLGFHLDVPVDVRVLLFSLLLAAISVAMTALVPALRLRGIDTATVLRGAKNSDNKKSLYEQKVLIVSQLALTVVLLSGSGIFLQHLRLLWSTPLGIQCDHVLNAELIPVPNMSSAGRPEQNRHALLQQIDNYPGVRSSCISSVAPFYTMAPNGQTVSSDAFTRETNIVYFTPRCFDVLGIDLVAGTTWAKDAQLSDPHSAIISRLLADRLFPNESAIGRYLSLKASGDNERLLITGIAADARLFTPRGAPPPVLYLNYSQSKEVQGSWSILIVRTAGEPDYLLKPINDIVEKLGTDYIGYIRPLTTQFEMATSQDSMLSLGASSFATIALLLSAFGIFGILTFFVNSHKVEIAIRMALGAERRMILKDILRQALQLAGWGLTLGVALSIQLAIVVNHYLYGDISTIRPLLLAAGAALIAVLVAASIPAFVASRLDPNETLRQG